MRVGGDALESLRAGRLMAWETRRFGREVTGDGVSNAVAATLARAGLVLPARAARRRGRLGRRGDELVDAFFAAVGALADLGDAPVVGERPVRRAALPWWVGGVALGLLVAAHVGLALVVGRGLVESAVLGAAVAVVCGGSAMPAGRALAAADEEDRIPVGSQVSTVAFAGLLVGGCVALGGLAAGLLDDTGWALPGGLVFGVLPAAVAVLEAAGAHPGDRVERGRYRDRGRAHRAHQVRRRRWARALARWVRAHARLGAAIHAVTGPAEAAVDRAHGRVRRHAARLGWRPVGHGGGLPGPLGLPSPPRLDHELRIPLRLHEVLVPDTALAAQAVTWLSRPHTDPLEDR